MNLAQLTVFFLLGEVRNVAQSAVDNVTHTRRMLSLAVAIPLLLLAVGTVFGAAGSVLLAHAIVTAAWFIAALLLSVVLLRASALTALVAVGSAGARQISGRLPPGISKDEAERFVEWVSGIAAWGLLTCTLARFVPLWNDVGATLGVFTGLLTLAVIMAAGWYNSHKLRHVAVIALALVLIGQTCSLLAPDTSARVAGMFLNQGDLAVSKLDQALKVSNTRSELSDVDQMILQDRLERQAALRHAAADRHCSGFCDDAMSSDDARLQSDVDAIKAGTFWKKPEPPKPAAHAEKTSGITPAEEEFLREVKDL